MAKFSNYFKIVAPKPGATTMTDNQNIGDQGAYSNTSWYQRLIQGSASRLTRYREYDRMDEDVEIARALDTMAEEIIGNNLDPDGPLELVINTELENELPTSTVMTLKAAKKYWCKLHDWGNRLFGVARTTIKYGDAFFIRNAEHKKWDFVHPKNVVSAIVDDRDFSNILGWQMKKDSKVPNSPYNQPIGNYGSYSNELVDTKTNDQVIRFTLNDDMSDTAPFGESVLKSIYRAQKQKELLEDAIIIYRIQRAPERRVFYIDVGKMPPQRVKQYLEQIKNEIRQKKIPTSGGGVQQVDSVYNPQCITLDTEISMLDDNNKTLSQLIEDYNNNIINWVYSIDPKTKCPALGQVTWAGITRKNTKVLKLTFSNGKTLTCTPDHKILVKERGDVEAKDIIPKKDLLYSHTSKYIDNKQYVYCEGAGKWIPSNHLIENFINLETPEQLMSTELVNSHNEACDIDIWVEKIDELSETVDVGTITVDGDESHHDYHNFAIASGIYIKNSMNEDFFFACLTMNTSVPLLDNTTKTISELAKEYQDGVTNWVYSIDQKTGKLVPGRVAWAGYTRRNAALVEVSLTNGKTIRCTPDHKFILRDGTEVEAANLTPGMKLMSLISKMVINPDLRLDEFVMDNYDNIWKKTFEVINEDKLRDCNADDCTVEETFYSDTDDDHIHELVPVNADSQLEMVETIKINRELYNLFIDITEHFVGTAKEASELLGDDDDFCKKFVDLHGNKEITEFTVHQFVRYGGYTDFDDYRFNHQPSNCVKSVEWLPYKEDTGCLYVIDNNGNHNFALDSGVYVKNSRPDGKGSRVEVLQGGQGLGELSDLEYFEHKVLRGLRIPVSYMEESGKGGALFNDGQVGVAYIQELRFALYIRRLQGYISRVLDAEFKRYLRQANILIDPNTVELKLPAPENFGVYRQQQLDSQLLNTFSIIDNVPYMSKRFILERYLQLSDEEIKTNERMKEEEMGTDPDDGNSTRLQNIYGSGTGESEGVLGGEVGGMVAGGGGFGGEELVGGEETVGEEGEVANSNPSGEEPPELT